MATLVVTDDAEVLRENSRDLVPDAQVGPKRIDEHERLPLARPLVEIVDDPAVDPGETHRKPLERESDRHRSSVPVSEADAGPRGSLRDRE